MNRCKSDHCSNKLALEIVHWRKIGPDRVTCCEVRVTGCGVRVERQKRIYWDRVTDFRILLLQKLHDLEGRLRLEISYGPLAPHIVR